MTATASTAPAAVVPGPLSFPFLHLKRARRVGPPGLFPLEMVWTLPLNDSLTVPPAFDATHAFFGIDGGRLVAYDLVTGKRLWVVPAEPILPPTPAGDLVLVVVADGITALRIADGTVAWRRPFAEPFAVPIVWANGWAMVATRSGSLVAVRTSDGTPLWQHALGAPANARPALDADRVYVPLTDGRVVALSLADGKQAWQHKLGGAATDLLPLDERMFVGSADKYLYCLRTGDGRTAWRWRTGGEVIGVPAVDAKNVYFVSLDNVVRALRRTSGVQIWKTPLPARPVAGPVKAGDTLIVSGAGGVQAFLAKTGASAGTIPTTADLAAPVHLFDPPGALMPVLLVCTQDIAQGAVVTAATRTFEPTLSPIAPLPDATALPTSLPLPKSSKPTR